MFFTLKNRPEKINFLFKIPTTLFLGRKLRNLKTHEKRFNFTGFLSPQIPKLTSHNPNLD